MTYLLLGLPFLAAAAVVAVIAGTRRRRPALLPAAALTLAVVLVATAVFDNLLVGLGIVAYDESLISGVRVGVAPIEDFLYAIAAVLALPSLWILVRRAHR